MLLWNEKPWHGAYRAEYSPRQKLRCPGLYLFHRDRLSVFRLSGTAHSFFSSLADRLYGIHYLLIAGAAAEIAGYGLSYLFS